MPAERITRVARLRSSEQFRAHLQRIGADRPAPNTHFHSNNLPPLRERIWDGRLSCREMTDRAR